MGWGWAELGCGRAGVRDRLRLQSSCAAELVLSGAPGWPPLLYWAYAQPTYAESCRYWAITALIPEYDLTIWLIP